MSPLHLPTVAVLGCLVSLVLSASYLVLWKALRSRAAWSYLLFAVSYASHGLRLLSQLVTTPERTFPDRLSDVFYVGWVFTLWLGARAYAGARPPHPASWAAPVLLVAWDVFAHGAGLGEPWHTLPEDGTGAVLLALGGLTLWRARRARRNGGLAALAVLFWLHALGTATHPLTRDTWYAPYGLATSFVLGLAIGMGLLLTALIEERQELSNEVSVRGLTEERLAESEQRFRLTLEAAQIGTFDWDVVRDRWIASPRYFTMLGYAPADGDGDREEWLARVHPDDRGHVEATIRTVLDRAPARDASCEYEYEARMRHADGTYRWHHVKGSGVRFDEAGRVTRVLGIRMDVTARREAEDQLQRLNAELDRRVLERTAELEASNKELESFAYSVSHDLRAPLRHIDAFVELLGRRAGAALDAQSRSYLATVSGEARRLGVLIDDLLAFSRMGRSELSPAAVDLGALAGEAVRQVEPNARGRVVAWSIGDLPVVTGDRAMLRLLLVNLVSNAVKFTRPRARAEIEVGCLRGEAEVTCFVRDNGVGFDMRHAARLFEVFRRLHHEDEFEGTGIGLASAKRIVARHGGRIWAEARPDRGATFYFSLPREARPAEPRARGDAVELPPAGSAPGPPPAPSSSAVRS